MENDHHTIPLSYQNQTIFGNNQFSGQEKDTQLLQSVINNQNGTQYQRPSKESLREINKLANQLNKLGQTNFILGSPYYSSIKDMNQTLIEGGKANKQAGNPGLTSEHFEVGKHLEKQRKSLLEKDQFSIQNNEIVSPAKPNNDSDIPQNDVDPNHKSMPMSKYEDQIKKREKAPSGLKTTKTQHPLGSNRLTSIANSPTQHSPSRDVLVGHKLQPLGEEETTVKHSPSGLDSQDRKSPDHIMMVNGEKSKLRARETTAASPISTVAKNSSSQQF